MKKNRIIQGIGVVITCIIFTTSCDDAFLDRKPYDDIASDNFYSSEKELNLAAVGLYGTLQNFYSPHYPSIAELPGDNASDGSGASTATGQLDKFSIIPNNAVLSNAWTNAYKSILQCNKILEVLPNVQFKDDEKTFLYSIFGSFVFSQCSIIFNASLGFISKVSIFSVYSFVPFQYISVIF